MKLSLNWLKDYVDLPESLSPRQIAHDLTMSTVEVESVKQIRDSFDRVILGKIEKVSSHPNADKLRLVHTAIGASECVDIVCGGTNLAEGMLVVVALPGAKVRVHGEGALQPIKEVKIRGEKSFGMICSSDELGLADLYPAPYGEIMDLSSILSGRECSLGTSIVEVLELDDVIFDIDNKSLTNRPDLWGHYGMARELSAIYNVPLKSLADFQLPSADSKLLKIEIQERPRCFRYIGTVIDGVVPQSSPVWLQRRLVNMGQRPISLLVDLTNYVMFALGQPTHVFDYEKVASHTIVVRRSVSGEKLLLLDGSEKELGAEDLVIADSEHALALAGIMGGEPSSVVEETKRIVLESACFEPISVRRTAAKYVVRTESSMRFEKGIDSERSYQATVMFCSLLASICPEVTVLATEDSYPEKQLPVNVSVSRDFIISRIGKELSKDEISEKLSKLGFSLDWNHDQLTVGVPSWRATGDVAIREDIVEEVARLYGYDNLEFISPKVKLEKAVLQKDHALYKKARYYLASVAGLNEIVTYPWVEEKFLVASGFSPEDCLTLYAPPSQSARWLKPSLIPNLLEGASKNRRHYESFGLFELSRAFPRSADKSQVSSEGEILPIQPKFVSGLIVGSSEEQVFFAVKGIVQGLMDKLGLHIEFVSGSDGLGCCVSGSFLSVAVSGKPIGFCGLISPSTLAKIDLERSSVAVFELNATLMTELDVEEVRYSRIPQFPLVEYDLSVIVKNNVAWGDVEQVVSSTDSLITRVEFVDDYRGGQVPEDHKSLSFRMVLSDSTATLTSDRVSKVSDLVLENLHEKFEAELRRV